MHAVAVGNDYATPTLEQRQNQCWLHRLGRAGAAEVQGIREIMIAKVAAAFSTGCCGTRRVIHGDRSY